jgi:uncharacterized protein (TIGR00369 family)
MDPLPAWTEAWRSCFGCGTDNPTGLHLQVEFGNGRAECRVTLPEERAGWPGVAHGGIVTTLLDEVMCYAIGPSQRVYTAELTVRYLKPVPTGAAVRAIATHTGGRGRLRLATGRIEDGAGTPLARAEGKFVVARP